MGRIEQPEAKEVTKPVVAPVVKEVKTKPLDKKVKLKYSSKSTDRRFDPSAKKGKFNIPAEFKDPELKYYWALNKDSEIEKLKAQDWFVVKDAALTKEMTGETGDITKIFGSIDLIQKETNHILMAKPREWQEQDKALQQAKIDKMEKDISGKENIDGGYGEVKK